MEKYLYVPIMLCTITEQSRPVIFSTLKKAGAETVFLASGDLFTPSRMEKDIEKLKTEIPLFEKEGFTVGVWINSFGFGVRLDKEAYAQKWVRIKGMLGQKTSAFCPLGKKFRDYYSSVLIRLAEAGAKTVLLDDDYCLSIRPDVGCSCKNHARLLRKATGVPLPGNVITMLSVLGKPTGLRKKWLDVMGESLLSFAKEMREKLDEKHPDVRLGVCAGYTSWDWEGVDIYKVARVLAGKHKPLLRLTGAPYWIYTRRFGNQNLVDVVECTRMQLAWLKDKDVEVFAENDGYPRPSYRVPAAFLETLDTATRAQGGCGDLKYMFDYIMEPGTETTYTEAHMRSFKMYERIDKLFAGKKTEGVRIYEYPEKAVLSYNALTQNNFLERSFFSRAATILGNAGIPTKYEGSGVGACFGVNAFYLPETALSCGLILDYPAALCLSLKGIDVGLEKVKGNFHTLLKKTQTTSSSSETDEETGESNHINAIPAPPLYPVFVAKQNLYKAKINGGARVLSRYEDGSPSSYLYENNNGQRFLVYLFEGASIPFDSDILLSYPRSRQLKKAFDFLGAPPAYVDGNVSGIYLMTKKEGNVLSLGLWNVRPDILSFSVKVKGFDRLVDAPDSVKQASDGFYVTDLPAYGSIYLSVSVK